MLRRLPERLLAWVGRSLRRPVLLGVALTLLVLGAGALAVTSAGLVSIAASSGHWPVTSWFLHYSMRRAVSTQSLGTEEPDDLTDPALVLKGAGHYHTGCLACHGGPGRRILRPVWMNGRLGSCSGLCAMASSSRPCRPGQRSNVTMRYGLWWPF